MNQYEQQAKQIISLVAEHSLGQFHKLLGVYTQAQRNDLPTQTKTYLTLLAHFEIVESGGLQNIIDTDIYFQEHLKNFKQEIRYGNEE